GIIAIRLDEGDQLIDVRIVSGDDDVVLATRNGMSIRFSHADARSMGRATRGVKGISLGKDDLVVGMVVAEPDMCLLTLCEKGFGKRTPFGWPMPEADEAEPEGEAAELDESADIDDAESADAEDEPVEGEADVESDGEESAGQSS